MLFSILSSWLTLALIFGMALLWPRTLSLGVRAGLGAATVLLLMTTPSFMHASGRAWNHDFPILLVLGAACIHVAWLKRAARTGDKAGDGGKEPALWWLVASGILVGLAAATRLTFVLAVLAFVPSILLVLTWRSRRSYGAIVLFAAGMAIGSLPALSTCCGWPRRNSCSATLPTRELNTAYYRQAAEEGATAGLLAKVAKTVELIALQPGNLLLGAPSGIRFMASAGSAAPVA